LTNTPNCSNQVNKVLKKNTVLVCLTAITAVLKSITQKLFIPKDLASLVEIKTLDNLKIKIVKNTFL